MGVFLKKKLEHAALGVWEINETVDQLLKGVNLSEQEMKHYSYLRSDTRRKQWLSYRLVIPHLVSIGEIGGIEYDEHGKPYLNSGIKHISVSHSGKFSALIASATHPVGVDIEQVSPKIHKIAHKFLNKNELKIVFSKNALEGLFVLWAAKEALFKLFGNRNLNFKESITIHPFEFEGEGGFSGEITHDGNTTQYYLQYMMVEDYVLVFSVNN